MDRDAIDDLLSTTSPCYISPPSTLECGICQEILDDPVCCSTSDHTFCRICFRRCILATARGAEPRCPIDRSIVYDINKCPIIVQQMIDELKIVCSLGCGWQGRRDGWESHLRNVCTVARGKYGEALDYQGLLDAFRHVSVDSPTTTTGPAAPAAVQRPNNIPQQRSQPPHAAARTQPATRAPAWSSQNRKRLFDQCSRCPNPVYDIAYQCKPSRYCRRVIR